MARLKHVSAISISCHIGLGVFTTVALASTALAGDLFEIQIYEAEVNRPWHPGLEAHLNYTISGRKSPNYDGEQPPHQVTRLTLEPALGITEFLEVGAYLQSMVNADGQYRFAGCKLRTKCGHSAPKHRQVLLWDQR